MLDYVVTLTRDATRVEQHDDRISVDIHAADLRLERLTHAGVERADHVAHEGFAVAIRAGGGRATYDRPAGVIPQQIVRAAGAGSPGVKRAANRLGVTAPASVLRHWRVLGERR